MGDQVVYPSDFDANLHMNPIGPLPRQSNGNNELDSQVQVNPPATYQMTDNRHVKSSSSFNQEHLAGLDEGEYGFRSLRPMDTLDNIQSSDIPDAETQAVLENLLSHPPQDTTQQIDPALNGNPPSEHDDTQGDTSTKKRRLGTSRVNMLARGAACEFCKRRKLKCSAEEPACSACVKMNRECIYNQKKQRSKVRQLEDRLADLEKQLDPIHEPSENTPVPTMLTDIGVGVAGMNSDTGGLDDDFWHRLAEIGSSKPDAGFTFANDLASWGINGVADQNVETLMELADAAWMGPNVAPDYAWEGMGEVEIASEIVKAVEGEKGVGEKIVTHLLQLYINPQFLPYLHYAVNPRSFLSRTLPNSVSPPHPALILSLVPLLLSQSPSRALSDPLRITTISEKLEIPSRLHAEHALSIADPRLLDIVATAVIRTTQCFYNARLLEGWSQINGAVSLAWAAGLGKLGGIASQLTTRYEAKSDIEVQRIERNEKLRQLWFKATLVERPKSMAELGHQINLFWQVYMVDKEPSIGWGLPSMIMDEEITTPFPRDDYERPGAMVDEQTINDFLEDRAYTGGSDSDYCAQMKALCLLQRATRLFDVTSGVATPERTENLKRVASGYMATLPPLDIFPGAPIGQKSQVWQMLHLTLFYVYLKEELDLPVGSLHHGSWMCIDNAINSASYAADAMEALFKTGDTELGGYDLLGPGAWGSSGRTIFNLALRLEREGDLGGRAGKLRSIGQRIINVCHILGKRMPIAKFMAQKLENNSRGIDGAIGIYMRTDNLS